MRILIVDELCYPQLGGQQVRFKELAEKWVQAGNEVCIAAIDHIGTLESHEIINGVSYSRLVKDKNYYKSGLFGRKISTIFKFCLKLKPFFYQKWDLIVFNQFPMFPLLFFNIFYHNRSKTILDFVEHRTGLLWRFLNSRIINAADAVICISNHIKSCAEIYRKDAIWVVPSLVDTDGAKPVSRDNFVFLGRLEAHKHPEHAIESVLKYNTLYNKNNIIEVVGGGSLLDQLRLLYKDSKNVIFHGGVEDPIKSDILSRAKILLLPSEREGLPKVVIEAMAYGIPTITTDYPGNGTQFFIKEEGVGLIAKPNVEAIAETINELESKYLLYSNRCIEKIHLYDLTFNSKKYLDIALKL